MLWMPSWAQDWQAPQHPRLAAPQLRLVIVAAEELCSVRCVVLKYLLTLIRGNAGRIGDAHAGYFGRCCHNCCG